MDWFDPSDDVVVQPSAGRARFWKHRYGTEHIEIAERVLFANNGMGRLFDAACRELDQHTKVIQDRRDLGYCHFQASFGPVTVYRAPEPAPYAAADLEFLISAGARQILFVNGAGSLQPHVPVGTVVVPGALLRQEGTSFHYAPPNIRLRTSETLNDQIRMAAKAQGIPLVHGKHWTTDAIYRETWSKVLKYRGEGVISVVMELSAQAGVAYYWRCELSAVLVVTDVLARPHTWEGTSSEQFRRGVEWAAQIVTQAFAANRRQE
jgi:uridine phosphorylase